MSRDYLFCPIFGTNTLAGMSPATESRLSSDYVAERPAQTNRRYAFQAEDAPTLRRWQQALRAELIRAIGRA